MEVVKIGAYSFNAEALKEKTLNEVKDMFSFFPEGVVAEAWKIANPKGYKRKRVE